MLCDSKVKMNLVTDINAYFPVIIHIFMPVFLESCYFSLKKFLGSFEKIVFSLKISLGDSGTLTHILASGYGSAHIFGACAVTWRPVFE